MEHSIFIRTWDEHVTRHFDSYEEAIKLAMKALYDDNDKPKSRVNVVIMTKEKTVYSANNP